MYKLSMLILLLIGLNCEMSQARVRDDRTPNFFIPTGAMQSQKQIERLPDVRQMRYQGEQAPIVVQIEQERAAKIAEAEKQQAEEQKRSEYEQKLEKEKKERLQKLRQRKAELQKKSSESINEENNQSAEKKEKSEISAEEVIPLTHSNKINKQSEHNKNVTKTTDSYYSIIESYQRDLQDISEGKQVDNPQLRDMLNDFDNTVHVVE